MAPSLAELESAQLRILRRIEELERSLLPENLVSLSLTSPQRGHQAECGSETTEARLSGILRAIGVREFRFKRVPPDYYDRTLEYRMECLGAHSIDHLCKSIVMVNTQALSSVVDCSDRNNSKYYVVVVQYTARLNAENIKNYLYSLNGGKIPKKKFNMRLAPEEDSLRLTGFEHNGVTCIGMRTHIPLQLRKGHTGWIGWLP